MPYEWQKCQENLQTPPSQVPMFETWFFHLLNLEAWISYLTILASVSWSVGWGLGYMNLSLWSTWKWSKIMCPQPWGIYSVCFVLTSLGGWDTKWPMSWCMSPPHLLLPVQNSFSYFYFQSPNFCEISWRTVEIPFFVTECSSLR